MNLLTLGINHKTAPIEIRERVALIPEKCAQMLNHLKKLSKCTEAVIVSTCNRTELYLVGASLEFNQINQIWADFCKLSPQEILDHLYIYHHEQSIKHLFRVACGLDSLVLGEPQILGQLKDSYAVSQTQQMLGKYLNHQFQQAFHVAKKVRTETKIGELSVSVAYTAVHLAKQIFDTLDKESVLLIGAGETIELAARHLIEAGVRNIVIANRTQERADHLITLLSENRSDLNLSSIALAQIDDYLHDADIVIASTGADHILIHKHSIKTALKRRKNKPMCIVDLAVPRDIAADIGQLDDVYLYDIDHLNNIIEDNQNARQNAAKQAEVFIDEAVLEWLDWERLAKQSMLIQNFSQQTEALRQDILDAAMRALSNGIAPELVLEKMSKQLCNKLNHAPIQSIKAAINHSDQKYLSFLNTSLLTSSRE